MTVNVTVELVKNIDTGCWADIGKKVDNSESKRNTEVTRQSHANGHWRSNWLRMRKGNSEKWMNEETAIKDWTSSLPHLTLSFCPLGPSRCAFLIHKICSWLFCVFWSNCFFPGGARKLICILKPQGLISTFWQLLPSVAVVSPSLMITSLYFSVWQCLSIAAPCLILRGSPFLFVEYLLGIMLDATDRTMSMRNTGRALV